MSSRGKRSMVRTPERMVMTMKFRIRVDGKESMSNGLGEAASSILEFRGMKFEEDDDAWDAAMEKEEGKLSKFVGRFIEDGEGGNDAVTLEFDTEAKTCVVVPVKKA